MGYLERNLSYINPKKINYDPHNPRGETEDQILSDESFSRLIDSVKIYGVLEPIIVRKNEKLNQNFILVDGERRWRASLEVDLNEIPALIATDEINGRILAYQVHKLRKDWSKKTETKSIKTIIQEIQEKQPNISEIDLRRQIREITNSKPDEIRELIQLLKYEDDIINEVIEENTELRMSHLIQIEQSFMPRLKRQFPEIIEKYNEHKIRHILAQKGSKGLMGGTRYLMDTFKNVFNYKKDHDKIEKLLFSFLQKKNEDIKDVYIKFQEISQKISKKEKKAKSLKKEEKTGKRKSQKQSVCVPDEIDNRERIRKCETVLIQNHILDVIFFYLKGSIQEFENRTNNIFKDERELQNFVFSILRCLFASVEFEDPTEKACGKFLRKDFVIKDHNIIIETKYIHNKGEEKKITDELSADFPRYKTCKYGGTIINYIYDPKGFITNHSQFIKELKNLLPEAHHYIQ